MNAKFLRPLCVILVLLTAQAVSAQVVQDNFSDGDFDTNPTWVGDGGVFIVNAQDELQLNDLAAGQSSLSAVFPMVSMDNREWRFRVRQTFAGSDGNQSRIYFATGALADAYTANGSAGVTGYFLKLGEGGSSDVVRIYEDDGSSVTELAAGTTLIAGSFDIGIRITRDATGNWLLQIDPAGGEAYSTEASFSNSNYSTSSAVSIICTYTVSNADNFFFDDIYFGDIIVDTAPPEIVSAVTLSSTELDVLFSEALNEVTAETISGYVVTGMGNPTSASLDIINPALVHLTFDAGFPENTSLTLTASAIQDEAGNELISDDIQFMWLVTADPAYRSVVFNEVLADPTPVVGLPEVEYVELFNASPDAFDLEGWQFVNTAIVKTLPAYSLAPGAFVVLCEDDFAAEFSASIGIGSFTALSNEGDSLTLLDSDGNLIDVLVYQNTWFESSEKADGGWSLEQVNPFFPCANNATNWKESESVSGGTPAALNSVFNDAPDTEAPVVVAVSPIDDTHFFMQFSEVMDTSSWNNEGFDIIPFNSVVSTSWNTTLDGWIVTTSSPLNFQVTYTITLPVLNDCSGNLLVAGFYDFTFGVTPSADDIIIHEIYADPDEGSTIPFAEYVELYNRSNLVLNLQGLMLNTGVILESFVLDPGAFVVVADVSDASAFLFFEGEKIFMTGFPSLTNSGLELQLKDADETVLDEVHYNLSWYHDTEKQDGGWSLELINPSDPCSSADNWTASMNANGGTPGTQNSVHNDTPDTTAPQLLSVLNEPQESVTLVFDEPLDEGSLTGLSWTVNGEVQTDFNAQFTNSEATSVVIYYGEMEAGIVYSFDILGFYDCWGNQAGLLQGQFALPEAALPGDLIINEILFNPFEGGKDFVEIYNNSLRNISLSGWQLADATNGIMNEGKEIMEMGLILYPGEYLVLSESGLPLSSFYPGTQPNRIWIVEDLPDFSSIDVVYLLMPVFSVVSDSVPYSEDMHYDLLDNTDGVSLERIGFERSSADETNWHSASELSGFATPGYLNSQSNNQELTGQSFEVLNEIFSPDNDGYQDVVTFSYQLDVPGFTGNITVFDSEGRRVRNLMQNDLLGLSGSISWDGFSDERQKAIMGIYIVYFEVFNPDGNVSRFKKSCVLAHPLD